MNPLPNLPEGLTLRETVLPDDVREVKDIVQSTGFFNPAEVDIAVELIEDRVAKGERSDYSFLFAERAGHVLGYTCYGHIDGTEASFDLYWIVVRNEFRHAGLGNILMAVTLDIIARAGGQRVYAETSSRDQYLPTRRFYERCGYTADAVVPDFYAPGDSKVIYVKVL